MLQFDFGVVSVTGNQRLNVFNLQAMTTSKGRELI
jgi:hypothetical protein